MTAKPNRGRAVRSTPDTPDVAIRAVNLLPESVDKETRSIEAVIATEDRVANMDLERWEVVDEILIMAGVEIPDDGRIRLFDNHPEQWGNPPAASIRGSGRNLRTQRRQLVGRLFFAADPESDALWGKYRDGHATDVSVGIERLETHRILPGQKQTIGGKLYKAGKRPLHVTTRWRPREVSTVAWGADRKAKVRSDPLPPKGRRVMNQRLKRYLVSVGLRAEATDDDAREYMAGLTGVRAQVAQLLDREGQDATVDGAIRVALRDLGVDPDDPTRAVRADPPADPPANPPADPPADPPAAPDADAIRAEGREQERARVAMIRQLAGEDVPDDLVDRAIRSGWDEARTTREFLDAVRGHRAGSVGAGPAVHSRDHDRDCTRDALAYGLMIRGGLPTIDPNASDRRREEQAQLSERGERYSDMALLDVCREAIRLDGGTVPHNRQEVIRAAVSGGTLTYLFTTSAYASVVAGYEEAEDTTDWCSAEDVPNFLVHDAIMLDKLGTLSKHPRGGTANDAKVADSREQYRIARYSKRFVVDEMDILDDRLNALVGHVPRELGLAAARLRPDLVYSEVLANEDLADAVALFHADHANLDSNALSNGNLQAGVTAMMQQTKNSVRLNIRPRYLVVPGDLEWTARELITSGEIVIAGTAGAVTERGNRNVTRDLNLQLRVEGRIDATGVTDPDSGTAYTGSATNWFLFSAPGKTIHVAYRSGTGRRPQLETFKLTEGSWGIGWAVKHDIGVKALDYRGCYQGNA